MRRLAPLAPLAFALACPGAPASTTASDPTGSTVTGDTTGDPGPSPTSTGADDPTGSTTTANIGDTTSTGTGDASTGDAASTGAPSVCGDAHVDPGEACDDGDADELDGCLHDCTLGPGAPAAIVPLPALPAKGRRRCLAGIDAALLDADDHAFLLGAAVGGVGPDSQTAAHVGLVSLPDGAPSSWTYLEHAGPFSRLAHQAATMADGTVVVAGFVSKEMVKPDSGGFLWLARFAPDGARVWDHDFPDLPVFTTDLTLTPEEDIVLVGFSYTQSADPHAHRFDSAGNLEWSYTEPASMEHHTGYRGVAADDAGAVYISATRRPYDDPNTPVPWDSTSSRLFVRALTADAAELWEVDMPSPSHPFVGVGDIERTADDRLIVAVSQADDDIFQTATSFALVDFDLAGAQLSWIDWSPGPGLRPTPYVVVAHPDGGVYVAGATDEGEGQLHSAMVTRFTADGQLVWSDVRPDADVADATLGPDGRLWVLDQHELRAHLP